MFLKDIKKLKRFSILIIPEGTSSETTTTKLTSARVIGIVAAYSLFIFLISLLLLNYTPLRDLFIAKSSFSSGDLRMMEELNTKLNFLTRELESLKSTNERLRYAIMLGDSTLLDSINKAKEESVQIKKEGNLLAVVRALFNLNTEEKKEKQKDEIILFRQPAIGYISREFLEDKGHFGIDYVLKTGSPVYAAASGFVIFADYTVKDGYMIMINHSNDYITVYKHCSVLVKREREVVTQGELIALSGNTGETKGPHLHFEIWKSGVPVNPKKILLNKQGENFESEK